MEKFDTGFDNPDLVAAAAQAAAAPVELTPEERRAAEIAEGQRQNARHAALPQHQQIREAPEPAPDLAAAAVESEAAKFNRELMERILAARNQPPPPPPKPQPTPPAIAARTALEMAEGQRMNAWHAEQRATARRVQPTRAELQAQGSVAPVFQPPEHVPNFNQGKAVATPVG